MCMSYENITTRIVSYGNIFIMYTNYSYIYKNIVENK